MVNLLGEHLEKLPVMHVKTHLASPLLWKSRIKSWQKMGHVTITTPCLSETLKEIETVGIWNVT